MGNMRLGDQFCTRVPYVTINYCHDYGSGEPAGGQQKLRRLDYARYICIFEPRLSNCVHVFRGKPISINRQRGSVDTGGLARTPRGFGIVHFGIGWQRARFARVTELSGK
jgi:hypothetical protein